MQNCNATTAQSRLTVMPKLQLSLKIFSGCTPELLFATHFLNPDQKHEAAAAFEQQ